MACAVYTVRNYKISNAHLAANAALRMACAVEDGRNYKISHAPLAANAARRMACAVEDGRNYKISHAPLAANAAREEGLHERSSYLISPDDLPPSEGEGATPENGMRHIHNLKR